MKEASRKKSFSMLPLSLKVFFFKTDRLLLLKKDFSFFELKLRLRPWAEKLTFAPGINTSEVLSKDGNMNREVSFEVSNTCISMVQY